MIDKILKKLRCINFNKEEYEECSICFKKLNKKSETLFCGHTFHKKCLKKWNESPFNKTHFQCPYCRQFDFKKV